MPGQDPSNLASPKAKTPPSDATMKYPPPSEEGTMPTIGALRLWGRPEPAGLRPLPGMEPWKPASPKAKMPPSEATSQYPPRSAVGVMPTTGRWRCIEPVEPWNWADPKVKMPPSEPTSQYPCDGAGGAGGAAEVTGRRGAVRRRSA